MGSNRRLLLGDGKRDLVLSANKYSIGAGADIVTLTAKIGSSDVTSLAKYAVSYSRSHSENANVVTFATLGTTETTSETITVTATCNGLTSNVVTITRAANVKSTTQDHSLSASCSDIPASGGYSNDRLTVTYKTTTYYSYTSGSTSTGGTTSSNVSSGYSASPNVHGDNLGTTAKSRTKLGSTTVTYNGYSASCDVYQQANTSTSYQEHSLSASCSDIPASGGYSDDEISVYYSTTTYYSWTSGSTSSGGTSGSWVDGYTTSQNLHGSDLGTTPKSRTKLGTVTVTYSGYNDTVDVYQAANSVTRRTYEFNIYSLSYDDIDAGGGYAYPSYSLSYDTYAYYTSGSSEMESTVPLSESQCSLRWSGTHVNSSTGAAGSASSLGTTVKSRTLYTTATVSGSYNGYSDSASCSVYQEANRVERTSTSEGGTTYGDITGYSTTDDTIPASGGTGTATASTAKQSYTTSGTVTTYYYTSGATDSSTTGSSSSGTINVSPSKTSITATAASRGTTVGDKKVIKQETVTWSSNGKSASATMYIYQEANRVESSETSGGVTTYQDVVAGIITNATIPAKGGSATATAGNGSQKWTKSATVKKDTYTSGSVNSTTTEAATSGTKTISPSQASLNASASSKGTVTSTQTTVSSKNITWSGDGGKSKSGTLYVYQDANYELRDEYDTSTFRFLTRTDTNRSAEVRDPVCSKTTSYSSGSTKSSDVDVTINSASLSSCTSSNGYEIKKHVILNYGYNFINVTIPLNIAYYFGSALVKLECICGQDGFQAQYQL